MFNRRRGGFGNDSPVPDNDFNGMTGYEEKTVFPMESGVAPSPASSTTAVENYGFDPASITGERPRVFTSRENAGVYIYEYSDRLEYFVKLENSMFRFNIVKKA